MAQGRDSFASPASSASVRHRRAASRDELRGRYLDPYWRKLMARSYRHTPRLITSCGGWGGTVMKRLARRAYRRLVHHQLATGDDVVALTPRVLHKDCYGRQAKGWWGPYRTRETWCRWNRLYHALSK